MRQAVAPPETVENNSFAVTNLLKICTNCERLSKKVRERRKKGRGAPNSCQTELNKLESDVGVVRTNVTALILCCDVFFLWSKQAAVQSFVQACLRPRPV